MSSESYFKAKQIESILNDNVNSISSFEITSNFFIVHLKNGDTIEVLTEQDKLVINHHK